MSEPLRNYDQAAAWLGVPKSWLENKVQAGEVPHVRIGKHVRFTQAQLDEFVAWNERRPREPEGPFDGASPSPVQTPRPFHRRRP